MTLEDHQGRHTTGWKCPQKVESSALAKTKWRGTWWWLYLLESRAESQLGVPPLVVPYLHPSRDHQEPIIQMHQCREMFWYTGSFSGAKAYNTNQLLGADVHV